MIFGLQFLSTEDILGFPFHLFGNLPFSILHLWKVYTIWSLVLPYKYKIRAPLTHTGITTLFLNRVPLETNTRSHQSVYGVYKHIQGIQGYTGCTRYIVYTRVNRMYKGIQSEQEYTRHRMVYRVYKSIQGLQGYTGCIRVFRVYKGIQRVQEYTRCTTSVYRVYEVYSCNRVYRLTRVYRVY